MLVARRAGTPYLCGAVCFRRGHHRQLGAVLTAEHLVAPDLFCLQAVVAAIVEALDALAINLKCKMRREVVLETLIDFALILESCGHQPAGTLLDRRICS